MTRLLLDEMLSPAIAQSVRVAGGDAIAVSERPELWRSTDEALLELAAEQGRVLITDNVADFRTLELQWLSRGKGHAGLLYISSKTFPMSRKRTSLIARALISRHREGSWPAPGQSDWLALHRLIAPEESWTQPGVDINDSRALLEMMDSDEGPDVLR